MNSEPKKNSLWLRWLPAILLMLLFFVLSSIPDAGIQTRFSDMPLKIPSLSSVLINRIVKKSGHFLGYLLLGLAYLRGLGQDTPRNRWLALGMVLLYALSDEYHQTFSAGRGASLTDVGIDTLGAALGLLIRPRRPASEP